MNQEIKQKLLDSNRRKIIETVHALHYVGYKRWDFIATNPGPNLQIWKNLYEEGKRNLSVDSTYKSQLCCGEEMYLGIRQELVSKNLIVGEKIDKKKTKEKLIQNLFPLKIMARRKQLVRLKKLNKKI